MADEERLTANVTKTTGGGSFYHADCPYCGKSKLLGSELLIMWAVCKVCRKSFNLLLPPLPLMEEKPKPEPQPKPNTKRPRFGDDGMSHGPDSWPVKYGSK